MDLLNSMFLIGYNMCMDKKSTYLLSSLALIFIASVYWNYQVFFIQRDFIVDSTTTCDPRAESCFMSCDAGECGTDYYAKITKRAYNIPVCNGAIEECESLICTPNEPDCEIIFCSEKTLQEDEACTSPEDFKTDGMESTATSIESLI